MKKFFAKLMAVVLVAGLAVSFTACSKTDTMKKVKESGKIVLGTSADYPPYEFHKKIDGKDEIVGFDIQIAKEIAKGLGVELEIKEMDFEGLLAALQTGKVDFVIAGMTPDEKRKKQVDFSEIYYVAKQGVVVRAEDKDKIKAIADLDGKKVGAQKGAIQEEIAKKQISGAEVKALGKVSDLVLELKNSKVDALVMELPVANAYVSKNTDLAISEVKVEDDTGGSAVAVAKGNEELVAEINKTLGRLMNENIIDDYVAEAIELIDNE